MLTIKIPGREELVLNHLILDYNGTIAEDGEIIDGISPRLAELSKDLSIYVITADTHGTAAKKCEGLPLQVLTFPTTEVGAIKAQEAMKGLQSAGGWIRREVGNELKLRYTPELVWALDDSITYGAKMLEIINNLPYGNHDDEE